MTKEETKALFKKIKAHYPNFDINDLQKFKEWNENLQEYSYDSVNNQLKHHLNRDTRGFAPSVTQLTRYAKKTATDPLKWEIRCGICGQQMLLKDYEGHHERETSVLYMEKQAKMYFDKEIDRDKYMQMSKNEFETRYIKLLNSIKDKVPQSEELLGLNHKKMIEKILEI